ncbi:TadE/TadG family type IV pilus assembly protein [Cystobacter fuscus]|uniref:TadE/TadG family type IV pilus assembly protein n=1 Tax=Cystobacter fuscus TaxID=43 RepID=UPI002B2CDA2E|nr:pilus assembly protein [Cystobacter fuscus]
MFRLIRKLRRDERGQAMIIGAIAMLILAVMVMTSVSIGHGVYSKIKTQDAADAQSYSIAVKQARTYNFLAYTNRAMVVHYSAMLTLVSYVSHALYLQKTVGTAAKYLKYIPAIGAIFAAIEQAINAWVKVVDILVQTIVPILTYINIGLWLAQEALLLSTYMDIYTAQSLQPFSGTDPKARYGFADEDSSGIGGGFNGIMNLSNATNFLHVLDDGPNSSGSTASVDTGLKTRKKLLSGSNALSDPNMAKYRLLMGNVANSVRKEWTARGKGPLLIGRRWSVNVCFGVGISIDKVADSQIKSFVSQNRRDELFASDDISMRVLAPCLGPFRKTIFKFDYKVRVTANKEGGFHQANGSKSSSHHSWQGITPFVLADPSYWSPWIYHFGYPCNMVFATKDVMAAREVFQLRTNFMKGQGSGHIDGNGELDMTQDKTGNGIFTEATGGMLAMSVGRAIYHRPGNWKEEPNFYNPLWTARLAPVTTHWEQQLVGIMTAVMTNWGAVEPWMLNY